MNLAISNIAWSRETDPVVLPRLATQGVGGLVISPTMVWDTAPNVDPAAVSEYRRVVEGHGLGIVGLQSLVFGRADVSLFGEAPERRRLAEHLKRQAALAGSLGARALIFGSPGLRQDTSSPYEKRQELAAAVFRDVAVTAADNGSVLAVEPLSGYGNRFVMTIQEGITLAVIVDHRGFGLHLDAAALAGSDEDKEEMIPKAIASVGVTSFDISAPELGRLSFDSTVPHRTYAHLLRAAGFAGPYSIELRGPLGQGAIEQEITHAKEHYSL